MVKHYVLRMMAPILRRRSDFHEGRVFLFGRDAGYHSPRYLGVYWCLFALYFLRSLRTICSSAALNKEHVAIVGMHRSGTSLTSKLLILNGLACGLHAFDIDRDAGYAENRLVILINDYLLKSNASSYLSSSPVTIKCNLFKVFFFKLLVKAEFSQSRGTWGFKDPRTSLTMPIWRTILPRAKLLIVWREASACVNSCVRQFSITEQAAKNLYSRYSSAIEGFLKAYKGEVMETHYESFLQEQEAVAELDRITQWLGLEFSDSTLEIVKPRASTDRRVESTSLSPH
jgi:hypothetical protein